MSEPRHDDDRMCTGGGRPLRTYGASMARQGGATSSPSCRCRRTQRAAEMLLRSVRHTKVHSKKTEGSATEICRRDDEHRAEDLLGQFPMLHGTPTTDVARREQ